MSSLQTHVQSNAGSYLAALDLQVERDEVVPDGLEDIMNLDEMFGNNIFADQTKVLMDTGRIFVEYVRLSFFLLVQHKLLALVDQRACFVFVVIEVLEVLCLRIFL